MRGEGFAVRGGRGYGHDLRRQRRTGKCTDYVLRWIGRAVREQEPVIFFTGAVKRCIEVGLSYLIMALLQNIVRV